MFDAAAWASTGLQYTAAGSMAQTNLTNVTSAHVDLLLNNGMSPTAAAAAAATSHACYAGLSVVGEIYVVAAAVSAAASPSSLAITASVVEGDVDSGAQRDSASKTFKQPPRLGRAAVAAAAATALPMARNVSVFVAKGAYSYWSLDVTPGFELRCSLQARLPRVCCCCVRSHGAGVSGRRLCRTAGRVRAAASGDEPAVVLVVS